MALTITPISGKPRVGPLRGQKAEVFSFLPDASKPAGGYTILASALGFTYLDFGVCGDPKGAAYVAGFRIGTASTDATLQFYNVSATSTNAGTDIGTAVGASVTGLTTNPVQVYVIGR